MQLIFSPPIERSYIFSYGTTLQGFLQIYGIFIANHNIEISYNNFYKMYDISVFKDCRNICGNGTKKQRDDNWSEILIRLKQLFPTSKFDYTWRHVAYYNCYTDPQDSDMIDGTRFFVDVGTITEVIA